MALDCVDATPIQVPHLQIAFSKQSNRIIGDEYSFDLGELLSSAQVPGNYFIVTCSCGIPECAGIYEPVRVTHTKDDYVWFLVEPVAGTISIPKDDLNKELKRVLSEAEQLGYKWDESEGVYRGA